MTEFDPTSTYVYFAENGDCFVIPRGVWHTARHAKVCRALFVTWGEGTESAPS